ncbi:MAG: type II toxin-antitoxin system RelE/ParE family toxin [Pirellulales bacterium]|nr:type II toxin-antitoxin system RelE/ParE family toxin [Pirellulales bacterium]
MTPWPIQFEPEAEADLRHAIQWYDGCREGLGREFVQRVDQALQTIAVNTRLFAESYGPVRQALVDRFLYSICFEIIGSRVHVLAVLHARRGWAFGSSRRALSMQQTLFVLAFVL